jgi:MoaA/NifB/PqqE/SkfB family radical SAM enzyme
MRQICSGDIRHNSIMRWSARRHLGFMLAHVNPRRALNAALCLAEMSAGRAVLHSHPFYLRVNVSEICNLRCPGCSARHVAEPNGADSSAIMSFDLFRKAVNDFLPFALKVNLYDEGEPLLSPGVFRMVRYLSQHRIGACISSHFSLPLSDDRMEELVCCGLEHLIVAVDGATQETYERYRVGGRLDLVLANLRRLIALQRALPRAPLRVEMQFLRFDYNRHEEPAALALAKEIGVWRFAIIEGSSPQGWQGTDFLGGEEERRRRGCYQTWVGAHISADGALSACDYGEDHGAEPLGWAWDYRARSLRNHPRLVALRRSFGRGGPRLEAVCKTCSLYSK